MEIGLALPQYDYSVAGGGPLRWETVAEHARDAERLGFDSLWLADHVTMSLEGFGAGPAEHHGLDPIVGLAALAGITTRPRLGALVLCSQLRPVTVLAKQLAGIDELCAGRLIAGMGAGWHLPDYEAAGVPFGSPGERVLQLAAAVDALRIVWRDEPGAPPCLPPPRQPGGPPIWIGGRRDRLLGVVARHGDGWNTGWAVTYDAYRERLAVLERACDRAGRDPATVTRSLALFALVGDDEADLRKRFEELRRSTPAGVLDGVSLEDWRTGRLVGSVDEVKEQLSEWEALGIAHLIVGLGAVPFQATTTGDLATMAAAASLGAS